MLQPDLGSALVLAALLVGVITVSGAPARWVAGLLLVGAVGIGVALTTDVLDTYQKDRLTAFADPTADPRGIGYQTRQVRIAIGNGGVEGAGLFEGAQTQGGFVPYQQTDFVFSVAGEELGFVGATGLLLLEGVVLWRGLVVARRAEELFGRLVAVGVVCWFTFQVFENVGMNLGIMPVTGLPLPFVSYGGSSMFASWLAVGLLQNVRLGVSDRVR
jgi:rod shape determining protein RodA